MGSDLPEFTQLVSKRRGIQSQACLSGQPAPEATTGPKAPPARAYQEVESRLGLAPAVLLAGVCCLTSGRSWGIT